MEKRKAASIITCCDFNNYGNRLQNFAVQYVLNEMGMDVITLDFMQRKIKFKVYIRYAIHKMTRYRFTVDKEFWKYFGCYVNRNKMLKKFTQKYIKTEDINGIINSGASDYFIIGSDQVWNPLFYVKDSLEKEYYLLVFAKPEQKICFSPSFGISELPSEWKPWFRDNLLNFPMISVREEAGVDIVKNLIGREATVTLDPTLMLDKEEWLKIASRPLDMACNHEYILTYFLSKKSKQAEEHLADYRSKFCLDVCILLDGSQSELRDIGPEEFIYLFSKASLVMTDSFHGCVFSFLFGKPFLVYERTISGMNSRIDTLLNTFGLKRKQVGSGLENDIFECGYEEGYKRLKFERLKTMNFLKDSMRVEQNISKYNDL